MAEIGGLITAEDLAGYEPEWVAPVATSYRGRTVSCCPPPNFGMQVLETLNICPRPPGAVKRP
jgi:gamma-glutamyltranspeptidase/glutathione hydrolase